jgi:hypothetical protein
VVDKVALGQGFFEYFGFLCQSSFHPFLHNHHHLSSGAGTIGQKWPQYKETQSHPTKHKKMKIILLKSVTIESPLLGNVSVNMFQHATMGAIFCVVRAASI